MKGPKGNFWCSETKPKREQVHERSVMVSKVLGSPCVNFDCFCCDFDYLVLIMSHLSYVHPESPHESPPPLSGDSCSLTRQAHAH